MSQIKGRHRLSWVGDGGEWRASGNFRGAIGHGTYKHFLMIFGNFSEKKGLFFWGERFVFIGKNSRWG